MRDKFVGWLTPESGALKIILEFAPFFRRVGKPELSSLSEEWMVSCWFILIKSASPGEQNRSCWVKINYNSLLVSQCSGFNNHAGCFASFSLLTSNHLYFTLHLTFFQSKHYVFVWFPGFQVSRLLLFSVNTPWRTLYLVVIVTGKLFGNFFVGLLKGNVTSDSCSFIAKFFCPFCLYIINSH